MDESQNRVAASIRRQLKQDKIWIDKAGVPHDLNSIDSRHRANLIPYLRSWAPFLFPGGTPEVAEFMLEQTPLMQRLITFEQVRP